jgi:ribonuclease HI
MTQPAKGTSKLADSSSNPQIGEQGSAITAAAATTAYTAATQNSTFDEAETQAIADALEVLRDEAALFGTAINAIISALEAQGLIADN